MHRGCSWTCACSGAGMLGGPRCNEECSRSAAPVRPRIHNMFSQGSSTGGGCGGGGAGHFNLFTAWSNWTKRLGHPRGRSICFSSGQSGSCAGTQSTVNILWGPAKILPAVGGKNRKYKNPSGLDITPSPRPSPSELDIIFNKSRLS